MPQNSSDMAKVNLRRQPRAAMSFDLRPDPEDCVRIAEELRITAVRKLRLTGTLVPEGARDWHLNAILGATVVQPCVVTLAPVTTRIDAPVARHFLADWQEPTGDEAEMPEDESSEALPDTLDLTNVMIEALALALPDYPRAPDARIETGQFAAPGVTPMTDDDAKPLAGLAALRDRMRDDGDDTDS